MIRCEHCGSTLPDGAIFCGECGRAVTASASRRAAPVETVAPVTPPPLQQPDAHGRRQDPATDAWLPEATLDPATRAWLSGRDRPAADVRPVPVDRPGAQDLTPRGAPTHVHGAGSGLGAWTGPGQDDGQEARGGVRPGPDRRATQDDDPDASAPSGQRAPGGPGPSAVVAPAASDETSDRAPSAWAPAADREPVQGTHPDDDPETTRVARRDGEPASDAAPQEAAPVWGAPVAQPTAPQPPAGPSWWIGRGAATEAAVPTEDPTAVPGQEARGAAGPAASGNDRPRPGDTAVVQPLADLRAQRPTPLVRPGAQTVTTCHVCGHQLEPDDIFCEECGAVRPAVTAAFTGPVMPLPLARPDWAADEEALRSAVVGPPADEPADEAGPERDDERGPEELAVGSASADPHAPVGSDAAERADGAERSSDTVREDAPDAPDASDDPDEAAHGGGGATEAPDRDEQREDVPSGSDEGSTATTSGRHRTATVPDTGADGATHDDLRGATAAPGPVTDEAPAPHDTDVPVRSAGALRTGDAGLRSAVPRNAPLPPLPGATGAVGSAPGVLGLDQVGDDDEEDVEETRIVSRRSGGPQFVLHFSTGERLGVHGSGLLGRLPRPAPEERFDDLLTIHDPGKSVSKTHLEFGRDGEDLWVADRFSGNGTTIRHIDGSIRRCEPGRPYRVERGARVDIGEQFFLVQ